ncbi:hypothetical protein JCM10908_005586 [Rhodotorula pacifica]|uniref:uncharacterized protein n=1 Tax=Rhodotorula pacifica TaxID=1495444 RepID=UPI00316E14E5
MEFNELQELTVNESPEQSQHLPGSYPYSEATRTSKQPSPSTQLDTKFAFPLLQLPPEVILTVIAHVDERDPSPTFPTGPCTELLRLSETSRWFHQECRARIWRSISYVSESTYRPVEYRRSRNIATLRDMIRTRRAQGVDNDLPILALSVAELAPDDFTHMTGPDEEEQAMLDVVSELAASTLQVLFLRRIEMSQTGAQRLLETIRSSPTLSALRFNQIDFWPDHPDIVRSFAPLTRIKTIQVMHSDPELFQLVDKCTNLDSLLLWPSTRRLGNRIEVIKGLLPHLRLLSLDSVREAAAFRALADEIIRLSDLGLTLPLEELFLEGPVRLDDFAQLLLAIGHLPNLQRLALYQTRNPRPALFEDLARVAPQLRALVIVAGDSQEAIEWPLPLSAYLPVLSRFKHLRFFAYDRRSPPPLDDEGHPMLARQSLLEYEALSQLVRACPSLTEAVAIVSDVSEGTTGHFARFVREKGRRRIHVKLKTVHDFLISWDRWVRVEED